MVPPFFAKYRVAHPSVSVLLPSAVRKILPLALTVNRAVCTVVYRGTPEALFGADAIWYVFIPVSTGKLGAP
jgi:hypothetical protein